MSNATRYLGDDTARAMLGRIKRDVIGAVSAAAWLPIVHRISPETRSIALTFDDGPSPATTPVLIDILRRHDVAATFFFCGRRASAHPDLIRSAVDNGHALFAHGYNHVRLDDLCEEHAIEEMASTEDLLARYRPTPSPYLMRLPYGAGHRSARMHRLLARWKADGQIAHWAHDFKDFRLADGCRDRDELLANCRAAVAAALSRPDLVGSVLLMHDDPFGAESPLAPETAPVLLSELLTEMRRQGIGAAPLLAHTRHGFLSRCIRTVSVE